MQNFKRYKGMKKSSVKHISSNLLIDRKSVKRVVTTHLPTPYGNFKLHLYQSTHDNKEHVALVKGDPEGKKKVPVRIHSECFTGDVLNSQRCDCGEQLERSIYFISQEKEGILIYLRQEGRGIGLREKLRAYALQDKGYDTVDANLMLGYKPDEREYSVAALILKAFKIKSVRLITNNPLKIKGLREHGIAVSGRSPIQGSVRPENVSYLSTKIKRMNHMMDLHVGKNYSDIVHEHTPYPYVTLSYAQSVDGCIAFSPHRGLALSSLEALKFTHRLRANHDAILVGIGTVVADDPCLTVRHVRGKNPQPVIVDSKLRFPLDARLLRKGTLPPWIITGNKASKGRQKCLEKKGARILRAPFLPDGKLDLLAALKQLKKLGISSLMVEGGAEIITSFLSERLVNHIVVTICPLFIGGLAALKRKVCSKPVHLPGIQNLKHINLGKDIIIRGDIIWGRE